MAGETILLDHGGGGRASRQLLQKVFYPHLGNPILASQDDCAQLSLNGMRLAMTTDSFVVDPLFFPGGDIGMLAVNGTVNDLAMSGAVPRYLSAAFILEEGLPLQTLERVVASMAEAAKKARVQIVTGDTKVVARGSADKLFINTAGVGLIPPGIHIHGSGAKEGDVILLSGPLGEHGIAVLSQRQGLSFTSTCKSDSAPLADLVASMLQTCPQLHCLRDPTRGGLAATLNELAEQSGVRFEIEETSVVVSEPVQSACDLLGLDPLHLANEGVLVAVVPEKQAPLVLETMQSHPLGQRAARIGQVHPGRPCVVLRTQIGGQRFVPLPTGALLPRIC